jgi:hypothetical protein
VSGFSFTQFATPVESKNTSKLFCFSFSSAISQHQNIDSAIKDSKGAGPVWNRLQGRVEEGRLQLEARPRIQEVITGLLNQGHKVAIFTAVSHPETVLVVQGFLRDIVKLDKTVWETMTIKHAGWIKNESKVGLPTVKSKEDQVVEIQQQMKYPSDKIIIVDAASVPEREAYESRGYLFYPVGDEQLLRDAGLVSSSVLPSSTSSSSSMSGAAGGNGVSTSGSPTRASQKRKAEKHEAAQSEEDEAEETARQESDDEMNPRR